MATDRTTPIAIIGMNMKFPGDAVSAQAFWELLMSARNVSKEIPSDRFNIDAFYHPDPNRLDSVSPNDDFWHLKINQADSGSYASAMHISWKKIPAVSTHPSSTCHTQRHQF
jgi:acyl transferase domain-containing protein